MATLITPDGQRTQVAPANADEGFTLDELYALLDCQMVQIVSLSLSKSTAPSTLLVCDEEGKLAGKPHNEHADQQAFAQGATWFGVHDWLVGNVLFCAQGEVL